MFKHKNILLRYKLMRILNQITVKPFRHYSDWYVNPRQTKKIFLPNYEKKKITVEKPVKAPKSEVKKGPRFNSIGIQMLSKKLYDQVFKGYDLNKIDINLVKRCRETLLNLGMVSKEEDCLADVDLEIPKLKGKNLEEHFYYLGEEQAKPYRDLTIALLKDIPESPKTWLMREGWTRYTPEGPEKVLYPLEDALVFDVEVLVKSGQSPVMATAVSEKAWYAWVSKSVIETSHKVVTNSQYSLDSLIPLEENSTDKSNTRPKIVIGHNVSYDRARVREQYILERSNTRFLDTMSMHICVSGLTSYQRALLKSKNGEELEEEDSWMKYSSLNSLSEVHNLYCGDYIEKEARNTFMEGTIENVKEDFQKLLEYCANDVRATHNILKKLFPVFLERFPHPVTLAGMLELGMAYLPVNSNWERYITNSEQTYEDLDIESRLLLAQRADQACQLLHEAQFKENIWMWDQDWDTKELKMKKVPTRISKEKLHEENKHLVASSDNIAEESRIKNRPRMKKSVNFKEIESNVTLNEGCSSQDDGYVDDLKYLREHFRELFSTEAYLPSKIPLLPGYPNWYRKLCTKPDSSHDWVPSPHLVSTTMQVTPKLLSLTWEGYPLHYIRGLGWGFLVPFSDDLTMQRKLPLRNLLEKCPLEITKPKFKTDPTVLVKDIEDSLSKEMYFTRKRRNDGLYKGSGIWCDTILEECCWFYKLPHKNGPSHRVGNPLAKDFLGKFSDNVLSGDTESAEKVLSIARQLSYWRNNKDRIMNQLVVKLDDWSDDTMIGSIVPIVVVSGTLTRRAVEPTWMTASNAHSERIGSELRAMVQAPPGYFFVGADVDSQELWIASVIGDAHHAGIHGCTPLGWMTLSGTKAAATDMHSVTAKTTGISREHAKVINYARIYGAGQRFAERLLKQFNPTMSESEAKNKASKMFTFTKGKQIYRIKDEYRSTIENVIHTKWNAYELAKIYGKRINEMFEKPKWIEGTESSMFNRLEEIAESPNPKTPFLSCSLSRALEPAAGNQDQFLPTRINWVVQSGAVDFLHLMLVSMKWLVGDKARFCLSFHDEVRYLVPEDYKYQVALAMHVTNLLVRSFCSIRLGLHDLPQSVAFFSSVEVDKSLRKEAKHDCVTPSNPHGLEKGYKVPPGESLDIYQAIEKSTWKFIKKENA